LLIGIGSALHGALCANFHRAASRPAYPAGRIPQFDNPARFIPLRIAVIEIECRVLSISTENIIAKIKRG